MELRIPKVVELEPWALMMSSRDNANLSHLGEEQKNLQHCVIWRRRSIKARLSPATKQWNVFHQLEEDAITFPWRFIWSTCGQKEGRRQITSDFSPVSLIVETKAVWPTDWGEFVTGTRCRRPTDVAPLQVGGDCGWYHFEGEFWNGVIWQFTRELDRSLECRLCTTELD